MAPLVEVNVNAGALPPLAGGEGAGPPIVVSAEQSDQHVRIYVDDSGEGVAPEFIPYLFERFRRNAGSATETTGTGLGLAIARSYAQAHGGDVFYHEHLGGARFELVVPAAPVNV